jgi:hypothetical protein
MDEPTKLLSLASLDDKYLLLAFVLVLALDVALIVRLRRRR